MSNKAFTGNFLLIATTWFVASSSLGAPSTLELERSLNGCWSGVLNYVDAQSNQDYNFPLFTQIQSIDDGHTFLRKTKFYEGPKRGVVYLTTLTMFNLDGDQVESTGYRLGHGAETAKSVLTLSSFKDITHWSETYSTQMNDGGSVADIQVTVARDSAELKTVKLIRMPNNALEQWRVFSSIIVSYQSECHAEF